MLRGAQFEEQSAGGITGLFPATFRSLQIAKGALKDLETLLGCATTETYLALLRQEGPAVLRRLVPGKREGATS